MDDLQGLDLDPDDVRDMVGWARSTSGGVCGTLTRLGSSQGLLYIDEESLRYSDYSLPIYCTYDTVQCTARSHIYSTVFTVDIIRQDHSLEY